MTSRRPRSCAAGTATTPALARLLDYVETEPVVTLVTATRDLAHAHTAVLVELIAADRTTDAG